MKKTAYHEHIANRTPCPDEWANVVPDAPYLDHAAPQVRHDVARDLDELYEELSIRMAP